MDYCYVEVMFVRFIRDLSKLFVFMCCCFLLGGGGGGVVGLKKVILAAMHMALFELISCSFYSYQLLNFINSAINCGSLKSSISVITSVDVSAESLQVVIMKSKPEVYFF